MSDVPPAHINGMLTFDAHGWSGSFSTWQDTGYKIVSFNGIPTTAKPDRGTGLKELRTMLTKIVGGAEKRTIAPVTADGLCAHGAYSNYNDFYEQTPSGPMVNLAGHHWVDLFDMLEDAHGVGMYNNIADGRPVYLVKVAVYCHEEVPVVSLHFMKTLNGGIPETESIPLVDVMHLLATTHEAIIVVYEFLNHPQLDNQRHARHFETMLPKPAWLNKEQNRTTKVESKHLKTSRARQEATFAELAVAKAAKGGQDTHGAYEARNVFRQK